MPFLAGFLPRDEGVDFGDGFVLVELADRDGTCEEGVDVELAGFGALAEEFQDAFYPAHELGEEAVVVGVDFVDEFVEVVFVSLAEVDEGLHGLVGVGGDILLAAFVNDLLSRLSVKYTLDRDREAYRDHIIDEDCKVCDAVVHVCGLIHTNKRLVEDGEEISQKL